MDAGTQLGLEAAVTGATLPDNASTAEIAGFYVGETLGAAAMVISGEALLPMGQEAVGLAASVYSGLSQFWGRSGVSEIGEVIDLSASNHINLLRLQRQLTIEQAQSIFTETGELTDEIIRKSRLIPLGELNNPELLNALSMRPGNLSDWGKYTTQLINSPSGDFQMHFYSNSVTEDVYYGIDYKAVFQHDGAWNLSPTPNFYYEPSRFNP
jgi:hypothetical protein